MASLPWIITSLSIVVEMMAVAWVSLSFCGVCFLRFSQGKDLWGPLLILRYSLSALVTNIFLLIALGELQSMLTVFSCLTLNRLGMLMMCVNRWILFIFLIKKAKVTNMFGGRDTRFTSCLSFSPIQILYILLGVHGLLYFAMLLTSGASLKTLGNPSRLVCEVTYSWSAPVSIGFLEVAVHTACFYYFASPIGEHFWPSTISLFTCRIFKNSGDEPSVVSPSDKIEISQSIPKQEESVSPRSYKEFRSLLFRSWTSFVCCLISVSMIYFVSTYVHSSSSTSGAGRMVSVDLYSIYLPLAGVVDIVSLFITNYSAWDWDIALCIKKHGRRRKQQAVKPDIESEMQRLRE